MFQPSVRIKGIFALAILISVTVFAITKLASDSRKFLIPEALAQPALDDPRWKEVERLIGEQKLNEASAKTDELIASAAKGNEPRLWTEALVRATQLRMGLHGYETAVRFLKEQKWPNDPSGRILLNLYYAHSLMAYRQAYNWEISQREKTVSTDKIDLKAWTSEQLGHEIRLSFDKVLAEETALGSVQPAYFSAFIRKNNYPEGVRPTLRDAVVYLAIEHLADTGFWRPDESNEIYKLGVSRLLATASSGSLTDEKRHPLIKLAGLANSLRTFHQRSGRKEAALEARYELYRRLAASMPEADDKRTLREALEKEQKATRGVSWWAAGQALLAEMVSSEDRPGKLIEALAIARAGLSAGGSTVGGQMCRAIVERIQTPAFEVTTMSVDGVAKDSVLIQYKNLRNLQFSAYSVDLEARWRSHRGNSGFPDHTEVAKIVAGGQKPVVSWKVDLAETKDFESHRAFVAPPLKTAGAYLIVASVPSGPMRGVGFVISDLVVSQAGLPTGGLDVRVQSGASGNAVAGAEVTLWEYSWDKPAVKVESKTTEQSGYVSFASRPDRHQRHANFFLTARKGKDLTPAWDVWISGKPEASKPVMAVFVYTDRSVYRPQQKLMWKIASFESSSDRSDYKSSVGSNVTVQLYDPNHQAVAQKIVKTNEFGTASGDFELPVGRPLGQWSVRALTAGNKSAQAGGNGAATIRVEEYKRPTFEAEFKDAEIPLRLNKQAKLKGEARYYFGLPVNSGQVKWRVSREQVYPWWWEYWGWGWSFRRQVQSPAFVASGSSRINEDGTFEIAFVPEADERQAKNKDLTYNFVVEADVTDDGGETRQARRSVRLGFVSVEARISWVGEFFLEKHKAKFNVARTNLDGKAKPGTGTYKITRLVAPARALLPAEMPRTGEQGLHFDEGGGAATLESEADRYAHPGDLKRARWETSFRWESVTKDWKDGDVVSSGTVKHGDEGLGIVEVAPIAKSGVYRIAYSTTDDFGAKFEVSRDFIVAGEKPAVKLPFVMMAEASTVSVGGKARVFVHSGLEKQPITFEIYRNGQRVSRRQIVAGRDSALIEIPITKDDRGGFTVTATALRDHQLMRGEASVFVPWEDKALKLEFATFRDKIRPGAKETFSVLVQSHDGKKLGARSAELLAYMYDRSLDLFAPHGFPNLFSAYPSRTGAVAYAFSLGPARGYYSYGHFPSPASTPNVYGDQLQFYSSYGIGGPGMRGGGYGRAKGMMARSFGAPQTSSMLESSGDSAADVGVAGGRVASAEDKKDSSSKVAARTAVSGQGAGANLMAGAGGGSPGVEPVQLRSDFSETGFWKPHLVTDTTGTVKFEFQAPDSVTSWNVWIHALTADLKAGSISRETKSVKELMVRPYAPRFLREGDQADIKVAVNNAGEKDLSGEVTFEIEDIETGKSAAADFGLKPGQLNKRFQVKKQGSTTVAFPLRAPKRVGQYTFRVVAKSKGFSDGERRPFPVLPSRMHLAQSRFVTLRDGTKKTLEFKDLTANDDATRINEKMVVTVDAQLFYGVLQALPYLNEYPYEGTEQTLNRFLSTGIVSSVFKKYPSVAAMAKRMSERKTQLERFDEVDANRRVTLEESPWLLEAKGGAEADKSMINVLDDRIASAQREKSLARLKKMQLSDGSWPWFEGGRPDPFMTLYLLHGFARAAEFKVEFPRDMIVRGWGFMKTWFDGELENMMRKDVGWEFITFLNYTLSSYSDASYYNSHFGDADRKRMLDFGFKHWKSHSPRLKGYLTLSLLRAGRAQDAKLVWDSVMDSAKTNDEQGTFWAAEDRSWLWYNDTIESHAFALRTLMELDPKDSRSDGMVQWLFLNKKLNHWKSTRATAEVIYSLVHYLDQTAALGKREEVSVQINNQRTQFVFEPEVYTGKKNQIVIDGPKVTPQTGKITVEKGGKGFAFASATWHFSTDRLPKEERGDFFSVSRKYFKRETKGKEAILRPLLEGARLEVGDQVEVHLSLRTKHEAEYVHLRDPRAAGLEPENVVSGYKYDYALGWYEETRDSGSNFFFNRLPVGEYTFKYRLRANMAGEFRIGPATVQSIYAPEFNAYSTGHLMSVK